MNFTLVRILVRRMRLVSQSLTPMIQCASATSSAMSSPPSARPRMLGGINAPLQMLVFYYVQLRSSRRLRAGAVILLTPSNKQQNGGMSFQGPYYLVLRRGFDISAEPAALPVATLAALPTPQRHPDKIDTESCRHAPFFRDHHASTLPPLPLTCLGLTQLLILRGSTFGRSIGGCDAPESIRSWPRELV